MLTFEISRLPHTAEKVRQVKRRIGGNQGFALLAVLLGIAVIAALLSMSIDRTASHAKLLKFETRDLNERTAFLGIVEAAGQFATQEDLGAGSQMIDVSIAAANHQVLIRDIVGLIDVNTAHLGLLERFFSSYNLPADGLVKQLDALRKRNQHFLNTMELSKLDGIDVIQVAELRPFLTVFSGRRGIAPDHAPAELLDRLTGRTGARAGLEGLIPKEWLTVPRGRIYALTVQSEHAQAQRRDAIVQVTSGRRNRVRILGFSF